MKPRSVPARGCDSGQAQVLGLRRPNPQQLLGAIDTQVGVRPLDLALLVGAQGRKGHLKRLKGPRGGGVGVRHQAGGEAPGHDQAIVQVRDARHAIPEVSGFALRKLSNLVEDVFEGLGGHDGTFQRGGSQLYQNLLSVFKPLTIYLSRYARNRNPCGR